MSKTLIEAALAGGWKGGFEIIIMLRTGVLLESDTTATAIAWKDIGSDATFWKALGKTKNWSDEMTEDNFTEYVRLNYHNEDTIEFFNNL